MNDAPAPPESSRVDGEPGDGSISIEDHPARRFVALAMVIVIGVGTVLIFRAPDRGAEAGIAPYLGETVDLVIHTEPGAAPDNLERFKDVTLLEIADEAGERSLKIRLEGMTPIHDPEGKAELWIPVDRVAAVWVGPLRVYWSPKE